jgi:hypothetical protein
MKCPGQDTHYWKPGAIFEVECPHCGAPVEFFKDDTSRRCGKCGHRFANPKMDFGCAAYCQHAEQCLGNLPPELAARNESLLKDRVAVEMKRYLKTDFRRIGRATRVARHAERIGRLARADLAVVLPAAYLLDIGATEAGGKSGENESGAAARGILARAGASEALAAKICQVISHQRRFESEDDLETRTVQDAARLEHLVAQMKAEPDGPRKTADEIESSFRTTGGREIAKEVLLGNRR